MTDMIKDLILLDKAWQIHLTCCNLGAISSFHLSTTLDLVAFPKSLALDTTLIYNFENLR